MDLSWAAVILLPSIVTPALLLHFFFRLIVPKSKAPPQNDFTSILLFCLLTAVINLQLIAYFANLIIFRTTFADGPLISNLFELYRALIGRNDYDPIRPFISLYSLVSNEFLNTNIFGIFLDLHLRPLFLGISIWITKLFFSKIKKMIDEKYYESCIQRWLDSFFAYITYPFKKYFFSYWNYVLDFNPNVEILMLDLLHDDGNLYSGKFIDWTPDDSESNDTVGSLGIGAVFKYGPTSEAKKTESAKKETEQPGHFTSPPSERKWRMLTNKGNMYVPFAKIRTIHIWKLKKGGTLDIWVNDFNTNERMKWYLSLASLKENFLSKINIIVTVKDDKDFINYLENFENFISDNGLDKLMTIIELEIFTEE